MFEKKMKSSHARGASRTHEFVSFDWICDPRFPLFDFLPFYFFFLLSAWYGFRLFCVSEDKTMRRPTGFLFLPLSGVPGV